MENLDKTIARVKKLISKLEMKNGNVENYKIVGWSPFDYPVYGVRHKNVFSMTNLEEVALLKACGIHPSTTALCRMTKRQHKILQSGIDRIVAEFVKTDESLQNYEMKTPPKTEVPKETETKSYQNHNKNKIFEDKVQTK